MHVFVTGGTGVPGRAALPLRAAALTVPAGIYNVTDGTGPVAGARYIAATGWRPRTDRASAGPGPG